MGPVRSIRVLVRSVAKTGLATARAIENSSGLHEIVKQLILITTATLTLELKPFAGVWHCEVPLNQGSMGKPARSQRSFYEGFNRGLIGLGETLLDLAFFTGSRVMRLNGQDPKGE